MTKKDITDKMAKLLLIECSKIKVDKSKPENIDKIEILMNTAKYLMNYDKCNKILNEHIKKHRFDEKER